MYFLHTGLFGFSLSADKENLFLNQVLLFLVILSVILVTLIFDYGAILFGEIRS